jgi:hypothetical protein
MRVGGLHPALILSLLGGCLLAQQHLLAQQSPAAADSQQAGQQQAQPGNDGIPAAKRDQSHAELPLTPGPALTPAEQRALEIQQFDPLDAGKDSENQEKTNPAKDNRSAKQRNPSQGSIAESEQYNPKRSNNKDADSGVDANNLVEEYSGPAVLSRSYSTTRPLILQNQAWTELLGVAGVYDTGVVKVTNQDGVPAASALGGVQLNWSLTGTHYFHHDSLAVSYSGNYTQYSGPGGFTGANNSGILDYTHVISRHVSLNLAESGAILSQNYILANPSLGSASIAGISISNSPNVQITDEGVKQFTSQADIKWQKTARLSFDFGTAWFGISRDDPALLGMTGQQARVDVAYRLTRKTTVGGYYSFTNYLYQHGVGNSNFGTSGLIYSYAFSRSMQLRLRGGVSNVRSQGQETVHIAPAIAALLGQSAGVIDSHTDTLTNDISAQFVRDFRHGATASIAFAHAVSPGNGLFQTSEQQSMSADFTIPFMRRYALRAGFGRDMLVAIGQNLPSYESDFGRIAITRTFDRGVAWDFSAEFRHFDIADPGAVPNQLRLVSGFTWGPGEGRLWPF